MRRILSIFSVFALLSACVPRTEVVVVYTSVDQVFSEPILKGFEQETGIKVLSVYDVEAAKTTGLVNRLIAEKSHPVADVFWSGEFAQTIILQEEGVLAPYVPPAADDVPAVYCDVDGYWTGFAGRARVFLVNTDLVSNDRMPDSLEDMLDPSWPAQQIGIAYPLFGTTATHAAALYAHWGASEARLFFEKLAERGIRVVDGNAVVRDMVVDGRLAFGLTDTDDACSAVEAGQPVRIILPDQGDGQLGTLIIPNTVALIEGAPNLANGKRLIDYLHTDAVAAELMASGWSHVDLHSGATVAACLEGQSIRGMAVSLGSVYDQMQLSKEELTAIFVR